MMEIKDLDAKQYFGILLLLLLLTDIVILLNIPFLRQIQGFLCFTIIPGLLIVHILRLNKIEFAKKCVLSVGLSVAFLIFMGLFINSLFPIIGISKPLSTFSLVTSFTFILAILAFIAYKRNKDGFYLSDVSNSRFDVKRDYLTFHLFFPFLFPFLTFWGVYIMNTTGNNIILLVTIFLIPAYATFIVYFNEKIPKIVYPVAIWMVALSITLMMPLRWEYIFLGGDASGEYRYIYLTAVDMYWNLNYHHPINACLSCGLLHTIYHSLLNVSIESTYKFLAPLLVSITPVSLFLLFKKYVDEIYAFLSSLLFMSCSVFFIANARLYIGILFFALAMLSYFDDELSKLNKKLLFMVFMLALVLSYYSYSYVFLLLIVFSWLMLQIIEFDASLKFERNITLTIIILCTAVIFLWYGQITESHFDSFVKFSEYVLRSLADAFILESRTELAQKSLGIGLQGAPEIVNAIIYYITIGLIGIGSIDLMRRYKTSRFGIEYTSMLIVCFLFLALAVVIPYISTGFGLVRVYFQTLALLSPTLIFGVIFVYQQLSRMVHRPFSNNRNSKDYSSLRGYPPNQKHIALIVIILIASQLMVSTGMTYQVFDKPRSVILNSEGYQYNIWYIHDQEITASTWLIRNREPDSSIYGDLYSSRIIKLAAGIEKILEKEKISVLTHFFRANKSINRGHIYLRYQNAVNGEIINVFGTDERSFVPITNYSHLFIGKGNIYDNGGSEIWN